MDFQSSDFGFPNRTQNPTKTTKNGFRISFSFVTNSKCGFDIPNLDFPVQIQIFQSKAPWTLGRRKARKAWIDTRYVPPQFPVPHTPSTLFVLLRGFIPSTTEKNQAVTLAEYRLFRVYLLAISSMPLTTPIARCKLRAS